MELAPAQTVQVFILSFNRKDYLRETLQSVLAQNSVGIDIEVIVSDNSNNDEVSVMMGSEFPGVKCIYRRPSLTVFDHAKIVIEESTADYAVFFHDDDLMLQDYLVILSKYLNQNPGISAVCCNAFLIRESTFTKEHFISDFNKSIVLKTPEELLNRYFTLSRMGPAPFPAYMYRRTCLKGLFLDPSHGGKYADVSFLMKILNRGPILWVKDVLVAYRLHGNNGSNFENVEQRLKLLRYIYSTTSITRDSKPLNEYRYRYWLNWWCAIKSRQERGGFRERVVFYFLVRSTLKYSLTSRGFWLRGYSKLFIKSKKLKSHILSFF